jgi:hypothetical protein
MAEYCLVPERTDNFRVGLVYAESLHPGLDVCLDYFIGGGGIGRRKGAAIRICY